MSYLTIAWSMSAALAAMLGLLQLLLWWKDRGTAAYALAAVMAFAAMGNALTELFLFHASSTQTYAVLLQWENLFVYALLNTMVWFVYVHLGTARRALAIAISVVWTVAIVANFISPGSLVYQRVDELVHPATFWGEQYAVGSGPANPWVTLANLSLLLILAYVLDASLRAWRQGEQRRAAIIGASIVVFLVFGGIHSMLVDNGVIATPYMVSFAFLAIVMALSYELVSNAVQVRRYAEQVALSEERWRTFLSNVELAVVGIDANGRINYVNPYFERISGYRLTDLQGRDASELVPVSHQAVLRARLSDAREKGARTRGEWPLLCASGEQRTLLWSNARLMKAGGTIAGFLSLGEDITERLKAQTDLENTRHELERLGRASVLGELASSLAHELNQPLAAILTNAQAARRFMDSDTLDLKELREIIEDIIRDDKRAGQVINSLRDMLRSGAVERERIDLNDTVVEVMELLRAEVESQDVAVQLNLAPDLPAVLASRVEMQQVIVNLVFNALQAMADVEVQPRRLTVSTRADDGRVLVSVRDNGRGVETEDLSHVFESFFTKRSEGLGMGLAICRRIVDAHGGRIRAANAADGGAVFTFAVPVAE
ncbi:MAG: hypothetical protein AMJ69_09830 [Gammaproteobacteria bacterium SG8_47]|nr:MAG: hypothetical protein AMJ69_09830 [Gammaproteobacteria bacterium SG8_47]